MLTRTLEAFCPSSSSQVRVFVEVAEARSELRRVRCGWGRKHRGKRALEETTAVYQCRFRRKTQPTAGPPPVIVVGTDNVADLEVRWLQYAEPEAEPEEI